MENLYKLIKQLRTKVEQLEDNLESIKKSEFHALQENKKLAEELQVSKNECESLKMELEKLKAEHQQFLEAPETIKNEIKELKDTVKNQRKEILRRKAERRKESDIFAHGSNNENPTDTSTELFALLQDIETIKQKIVEERSRYEEELMSLQNRLDEQKTNSYPEKQSIEPREVLLEERLKLIQADRQQAITRAEAAEEKLKNYPVRQRPLIPLKEPPATSLERSQTLEDLTRTIGSPNSLGETGDIISAIKEGKFTLRKRKKQNNNNNSNTSQNQKTQNSEILNILGSLKRTPKT